MNAKRVGIGIGLLVIAVLAVIGISFATKDGGSVLTGGCASPTVVQGYYGGEKEQLLRDPQVQQILRDKYCITVNARKAGSLEMARDIPLTPQDDFLWPSSSVSLALYKERGGIVAGSDNIFNSPLVLYTRPEVADALIKQGIVQKRGDTYYITRFDTLVGFIQNGKKWSEIGLPQLNGRVTVRTTDPNLSNSGTIFIALLAYQMNGGDVPDMAALARVNPTLVDFIRRLGNMEPSSSDLFQQYLTTGIGARPLVAGYESQLIEFALQNPNLQTELQGSIMLYPEPTVWAQHPFIARTANGKKLLQALKDPDIQRLAWELHGFRSGLPGVTNDPRSLPVKGVPKSVDSVVDMPAPSVMEEILRAIGGK